MATDVRENRCQPQRNTQGTALSLPLSLALSICLYLSRSLPLPLSLSLTPSASISHSLYLPLSLSLSPSASISRSLLLSIYPFIGGRCMFPILRASFPGSKAQWGNAVTSAASHRGTLHLPDTFTLGSPCLSRGLIVPFSSLPTGSCLLFQIATHTLTHTRARSEDSVMRTR